jgi:hypothetical protein
MNTSVRFFVVDFELEEGPDLIEVNETEFLAYEGEITYERHTVRENGCAQICLTKGLTS